MDRQQNFQECIAFLLIKGNRVLAEKRKRTKKVMPGAIALPGGHMEEGEAPEETFMREVREELGIVPTDRYYVCTLLHRSQEFRKLHYFAIHQWKGEITNHDAEALLWVPFDELETLDLDVDRIALSEYLRVYQTRRRQQIAPHGTQQGMTIRPGWHEGSPHALWLRRFRGILVPLSLSESACRKQMRE